VPLDFTIGAGAQLTICSFSPPQMTFMKFISTSRATNATAMLVAFEQLPLPSNTNALQFQITNQQAHAVIVRATSD
jgi:hypothetical protein